MQLIEITFFEKNKINKIGQNNPNYRHGGEKTRLYNIWCKMKQRILNSKDKSFKNYGGRGITICPEWAESYIVFRDWALSHEYADNLQIDRKNTDGNYEPSNCHFVTSEENNRNRRNNKLNIEKANEIRYLYNTGNYSQNYLAKKFNINQSKISYIINNKQWKN